MKPVIKNLPKKIYLQVVGDGSVEPDSDFKKLRRTGEVTWNDDRIFPHDVCYILKPKNKIYGKGKSKISV